jgi:DNA-binding CsgD family transcriptional regulator
MNQLTQAEQEVFALTIDGHSISEIQGILHKEECTIKNQRRSILTKLNTPSMTEAVQ